MGLIRFIFACFGIFASFASYSLQNIRTNSHKKIRFDAKQKHFLILANFFFKIFVLKQVSTHLVCQGSTLSNHVTASENLKHEKKAVRVVRSGNGCKHETILEKSVSTVNVDPSKMQPLIILSLISTPLILCKSYVCYIPYRNNPDCHAP